MGENAHPAGNPQNPKDLGSKIAELINSRRASSIEIGNILPSHCVDKELAGIVSEFLVRNNYSVVLTVAERGAPYYAALMLSSPDKSVLLSVVAYSQTPDCHMAIEVLSFLQRGGYKDLIFSKVAELALREGNYKRDESPRSCHLF